MAKKNNNTYQLFKINGNKKLIEFNDALAINTFKEDVSADRLTATVHSSISKIKIKICDYSSTPSVTVEHNIDAEQFAGLAELALTKPEVFSNKGYTEEKINPYKTDENGLCPVCKIAIKYDPSRNLPWFIAIENGVGKAQRSPNTGGINIAAGSYKSKNKAFINLDYFKFSAAMTKISRYIHNFELLYFSSFVKRRDVYRQSQRTE